MMALCGFDSNMLRIGKPGISAAETSCPDHPKLQCWFGATVATFKGDGFFASICCQTA